MREWAGNTGRTAVNLVDQAQSHLDDAGHAGRAEWRAREANRGSLRAMPREVDFDLTDFRNEGPDLDE